jgi:hypothetical protein
MAPMGDITITPGRLGIDFTFSGIKPPGVVSPFSKGGRGILGN